jgi:hypothetical protein
MERPLLKALQAKKKTAPGAKQYIVEQLRKSYQSNFQWFNGSQVVTYNRRQTIEQANYAWRSCHDGFGARRRPAGAERHHRHRRRLDQRQRRREDPAHQPGRGAVRGAEAGLPGAVQLALHLDGTQATDAITGLDALVSLAPTSGTVGGIDRSARRTPTGATTWPPA